MIGDRRMVKPTTVGEWLCWPKDISKEKHYRKWKTSTKENVIVRDMSEITAFGEPTKGLTLIPCLNCCCDIILMRIEKYIQQKQN